jgi:predicted nuclease of restriction endonuclease-like (RecB) superfamily
MSVIPRTCSRRALGWPTRRPKKVAQPVRQTRAKPKVAQPVRQSIDEGPPKAVAGLPWGHNVVLFQKVKAPGQRLWYAMKTVEHGWSRAVLTVQIESGRFAGQGYAATNFEIRLPAPHSDLAQQSFKDPYLFDFVTLREQAVEQDREEGLVAHIQKFLLELGTDSAFVGRQLPVTVGDTRSGQNPKGLAGFPLSDEA